eukprot:TRINITY_DN1937_c0_g1_i1.p1 TRINITY_DN1937_c0_g1~~TRINITY_DN1937_c0_g1_i1.p1  ORF type:complete len:112 (-),score=9.02 TRINITY_DN1937_c0_g1_i1:452-787(-)
MSSSDIYTSPLRNANNSTKKRSRSVPSKPKQSTSDRRGRGTSVLGSPTSSPPSSSFLSTRSGPRNPNSTSSSLSSERYAAGSWQTSPPPSALPRPTFLGRVPPRQLIFTEA